MSEVCKVLVEIPLLDKVENQQGYSAQREAAGHLNFAGHLNIQLGKESAQTFIRLREALKAISAKLPNGRPVASNSDVLKWMLQHIHESESKCGSQPVQIPQPVSLFPIEQPAPIPKKKAEKAAPVPAVAIELPSVVPSA
jgi:hypothetical protein